MSELRELMDALVFSKFLLLNDTMSKFKGKEDYILEYVDINKREGYNRKNMI